MESQYGDGLLRFGWASWKRASGQTRKPGTRHLKRRQVGWRWEDPDAQAAFVEWVGFPNREATAHEVDDIERLLNLQQTEEVLDVGCGNGGHAVEMAKRGYRIVGIDIAGSYLREAEQEAKRAGVSVEFRLQRASNIAETACYDAVIAINHTLGFMDDDELRGQFERLAQAIRPGGMLLLKTAGPQCIPNVESRSTKNWGEKDGRFILSEKRMEGSVRIEHNIVIDIAKNEIVEYHEEQRAFRAMRSSTCFERQVSQLFSVSRTLLEPMPPTSNLVFMSAPRNVHVRRDRICISIH